MTFKKIMLVAFIILAIVSIGAVSAADDNVTSDELTVSEDLQAAGDGDEILTVDVEEDNAPVEQAQDEEVISEKQNVTMTIEDGMPSVISVADDDYGGFYERVSFSDSDVEGELQFFVDGNLTQTMEVSMWAEFDLDVSKIKQIGYGVHNWQLNYSGDDNFNPTSLSGTFEITYMDVSCTSYVYDWDNQAEFSIKLPNDATGKIQIYINGTKKYEKAYAGDGLDVSIPVSSYGKYKYKVVHLGDSNYPGYSDTGTFERTYIECDVGEDDPVGYGDAKELSISLPDDITGNIEIYVNKELYKRVAVDSVLEISIDNLIFGDNEVTVKYPGSKNYPAMAYTGIVTTKPKIKVDNEVEFNDELEITLTLPEGANGTLVAILDEEFAGESNFTNGTARIVLPQLPFNNGHSLFVYYNGTDYEVEEEDTEITVIPKVRYHVNEKTKYVEFELPSDATGTLQILFDDVDLDVTFENGKGIAYLPKDLDYECPYFINLIYYGNYPAYEDDFDFELEKPVANITVSLPSMIIVGNEASIVFNLPNDANGDFWIETEDDDFYGTASKGKAVVKVLFERTGTFNVRYSYEYDDKYQDAEGNFTVVVKPRAKITASALTMSYSDGSAYKVRILDSDGNPVGAGKAVTFKINGKKVASVKTDSKGYASFKPSSLPGTYKISATSLGTTVTKKLVVKQVLTFKSVKVKKSAKKIVLQANLAKVKGKFLSGKKIFFKFNGKSYAAKTNSKGVAKVTVSKSILNKLKVGKKINYQASYLKVVIKRSAKVSK